MKFDIETCVSLGFSHFGEEYENCYGEVDLTEEEVSTLVNMIREKETADVKELGLEESHPDLYEKLSDACYNAAYDTQERHWLWRGYHDGVFDVDEALPYCKVECGFTFEYDEEDYRIDEDEIDEDALEDDELEFFHAWLEDYLAGLDEDEFRDFFYNHLNVDLDLDGIDYDVEIPQAIIDMASEKQD